MLHAVPDGVCLHQLGGVDEKLQAGRIQVGPGQIGQDLSVGISVALMPFHHAGEDIPVLRRRELLDGAHCREGLEAELRQIAEHVLSVIRKRRAAVPDIPVVDIAGVRTVGIPERAAR